MIEIEGGVDVSITENEEFFYVGVVLGTKESINSIMRKTGREEIHMSRIASREDRKLVRSQIKFDGKNCIAIRVQTDWLAAYKDIRKQPKKFKNAMYHNIVSSYYHLLWRAILPEINNFLHLHNCELSDVKFECDSDSEKFIMQKGLTPVKKGKGHSLADVAAWYDNDKDMRIDSLITMNIVKKIKDELERKFKRR